MLLKDKSKKYLIFFFLFAIVATLPYIWHVYFNYRFAVISENKVYKSGVIPPEKIASYINKYKIKTVIDLRHPGLHDPLNPGKKDGIDLERAAIEKIPGVKYVNIPSDQVPTRNNLNSFFNVMDDSESYPVLIHCYHGIGRAVIYSALYRIEYEGFSNEAARAKTRVVLNGSSFDEGKSKGDFLINYKSRKHGGASTLATLNYTRGV